MRSPPPEVPVPVRPRPVRTVPVVLALLALLLAGCRLDVVAQVVVERDGSGRAVLALTLDAELRSELASLAVDPTAELTAGVAAAPGWTLERSSAPEGGLQLELAREVADPDELMRAFRDLRAGLTASDPALLVDLDVEVDADGAARLRGAVSLRPPVAPGVEGVEDAPDAGQLAELTARHVSATLQVTLPAAPSEHDADHVEDRTLTWSVPVDGERVVTASSPAPSSPRALLLGLAVGLLVLAGVGAVSLWRRR